MDCISDMYNLIICNMNYKKSYSVINYSLNKKARTPSNVEFTLK